MNYKMMGRFLAQMIGVEAVFLLPALGISVGYGELNAVRGIALTFVAMLAVSGILYLLCRRAGKSFGPKEGLVCVGISWIVMSLLGCLPFLISGAIPKFIDALFEIVSGFTTTGASILTDVEAMPKGLLYWRSFSHWLGGMGVLVFLLAIAPGEKGSGFTMHLLRAESPGPDVGKLVPKMKKTAAILYLIYVALTALNILFLLLGGMSLLESVCIAFGSAGTGGFAVKNDSMAGYSPYLQNVTTVFMFLFGVNFSCYYLLLLGKLKNVLKDEELHLYVGLAVAATVAITLNIVSHYDNLWVSLRHAAFQVSSVMTTTGYSTTDFDQWPGLSRAILLMLMVVGACAGSTGGGLKCARVVLLFKSLRRNIRKVLNPQKVQVVRLNGHVVDEKVLDNTNAYLAAYVIITVLSVLIISMDNFSIGTNVSAVFACFNNIGPGLEAVGPMCNYSAYSGLSKLILIVDMLAGRLEIFPLLVLLSKSAWKKY